MTKSKPSSGTQARRDHFVPQGYFRGFIHSQRKNRPKPLWVLDVNRRKWSEKSPIQIGWERGFYDYTSGSNPDATADDAFRCLENDLSRGSPGTGFGTELPLMVFVGAAAGSKWSSIVQCCRTSGSLSVRSRPAAAAAGNAGSYRLQGADPHSAGLADRLQRRLSTVYVDRRHSDSSPLSGLPSDPEGTITSVGSSEK